MNKISKVIFLAAVFAIFAVSTASSASVQATIKEKDEAARVKYQETFGQYQKEVNFFKTARENFQNTRAGFQKSKTAENRKNLEEKTKSFLGKTISALTKKLEALKNWVSNKRALGDNERQVIIQEIDKDIAWLNERAGSVGAATPEQIKEEAKTIREYWKKHRLWVKKITGQIWAARVNFVIGKAEDFAGRIEVKIEELKSAGKDTAQLEAWLLEFRNHIALAKEKYEAAKAKFAEINAEPGPDFDNKLRAADDLFKAGHNFIKEANQRIKEAYAKLRQIINEIKKAGKAIEAPVE